VALANPFLSRVAVALRRNRPPLSGLDHSLAVEDIPGGRLVRLWFRSGGCSHDARGLCAMCNYGGGRPTTDNQMVAAVRAGLASLELQPSDALLVSPSGSMFDDREVPGAARAEILRLVGETRAGEVICETRAETVTPEAMAGFSASLPGKVAVAELGLESAEPWVLRSSLNKHLDLARMARALRTCAAAGVTGVTNITLGAPFLSPAEAINDCSRTAAWALSHGADSVVLFPLQVREWTVLSVLHQLGRYTPVSLWALAAVVAGLDDEAAGRTTISWYRDYDADAGSPVDGMRVLASPDGCPSCRGRLNAALSDYRASRDRGPIQALLRDPCACYERWLAEPPCDRRRRAAEAYELVGRAVLGDGWWAANGSSALAVLEEGQPPYVTTRSTSASAGASIGG